MTARLLHAIMVAGAHAAQPERRAAGGRGWVAELYATNWPNVVKILWYLTYTGMPSETGFTIILVGRRYRIMPRERMH